MNAPSLNIAAIERETGLSKDVLRIWERRYGFPVPDRDAHGERLYPVQQLERLRLIKRLMDQGHRPGKLMATSNDALAQLAPRRPVLRTESTYTPDSGELTELLGLIQQHDAAGYQHAMQQRLARQGLLHFVQHTVAPLAEQVGEAWASGRLAIFEEHLFTELTQRLLRHAIASLPRPTSRPRIVLTTVPEEQHALGLLMVESLLALEGATCIPLGTQTPLAEISRAALAHQADIVALSFSSAFPKRPMTDALQTLRHLLPPTVELWVGGDGVASQRRCQNFWVLPSLEEPLCRLAQWRAQYQTTLAPAAAAPSP